jgi:tRNA threonylcarbamoyladenosine biosynthesis protein TsaE
MKAYLPDESATLAFAASLMRELKAGAVVFLRGELGAGKTTFARGCLRALGYQGAVKSPTFTLVEEYAINGLALYHFDLYRLNQPEELEWMGMRDYLRADALCFIEWPERGAGMLPPPDLDLAFAIDGLARRLEIQAHTQQGRDILHSLKNRLPASG